MVVGVIPRGGLEVPCILTFSTPQAYESEKTKKLVESSLALPVKLTTNIDGDKIAVYRVPPIPAAVPPQPHLLML